MLNFGASKPRVKGGALGPRGPPPGSAPERDMSPHVAGFKSKVTSQ